MKHAKYFQLVLVIFLLIISFSTNVAAQSASKSDSLKSDFKNMVDSQRFVFEAQSVNPLRGNFRNLTSPYDVSVTKDTLRSYLPYFGRAHNPSYGTSQSALDFTSTDFSYSVTPNKKGGWNIAIKPKDKTDIQEYLFTVFDNGNASLNVTSTSRDAISFNGYVRAKK
ncbi:MAG TPA: DUF4251 domain-containing protein [Ginsengibacter sp.]|nr:DUF4251 domain-containing protein [Ginsengibacter sp.]